VLKFVTLRNKDLVILAKPVHRFFKRLPAISRQDCVRSVVRNTWPLAVVLMLVCSGVAVSQESQRWITDSFEITMRTSKNKRATIKRMLASGTKLEVLEADKAAGYSRVRTRGGTEGWVLTRYLLKNPPARVALPDVQSKLKSSDERRKALEQKTRELSQERDALRRQIDGLENSGQSLQGELENVRRLSSDTIQIDSQNKKLRQSMLESERVLAELETENRRLSSRSNREWFIIGAVVMVLGIVLGLILPRIRWRRKSSWGDF
jgi:SH3 domain protein